jgi:hypothetical protein
MSEQYFVVGDVRKSGDDVRVVGQFIVDGEFVASGSVAKSAKAKIKPIEPFQVKWVVGPGGQGRDMAEAMGYETVAYDDLRYPPPRV